MPKSNPWISSLLFILQQQQKPSFETEAAHMKRCSSFPRLVILKGKLPLAVSSLRSTGRAHRGVLELSHISSHTEGHFLQSVHLTVDIFCGSCSAGLELAGLFLVASSRQMNELLQLTFF